MKQYIADAFTDRIFHGNQAAICLPETWLSDEMMMNITKENNFSETAFAVKEGDKHHLRWFTPGGEIDLCGHATLACAYVLFRFVMPDQERVVFTTMSGDLTVVKKGELLEMEFPSYDLKPVKVTDEMALALGARPKEAYMARDLLCVYDDENIVRNMKPDMEKVKGLEGLLVHVTAPGSEDPVCGSGHCHIIPYWTEKTGKNTLTAYQASPRGGTLYCRKEGNRIFMAGKAVLYSTAKLMI